jgi:predicted methyltransferase
MKYLIRANKVVFSGNMQMIMKYISDFYKSESKIWTDKDGNFTDLGKFKTFIESMDYTIKDRIPGNCRCEGTAVSISDFKRIYGEEHFNIKAVAERLHITERMAAQLARKLKVKK